MTKLSPDQIDNDIMPLITDTMNKTVISTYNSSIRLIEQCQTVEQAKHLLRAAVKLYEDSL